MLDDGDEQRARRCAACAWSSASPTPRAAGGPVPVAGSEFEFETDMVVFAIGTNANPIIGQTSKLKLDKRGYIATDENLATSMAGRLRRRRHRHRRGDRDRGDGRGPQGRAQHEGLSRPARHRRVYARTQRRDARCSASTAQRAQLRARARRLSEAAMNACHDHDHHERRHLRRATARRRRRGQDADVTLDRAHRRDHQRLRRGRAALRPVARRDRRADGQRHLDRRDHPGRDPAAGAQRRRRQRQPHPHRRRAASPTAATRPTWWSRSTSRCCSGACAPASSSPAASILLESMWREHRDPKIVASYVETRRPARGRAATACTRSRWSSECRTLVADPRTRQEHVRARHAVQHLQPRPASSRASRSRSPSARRTRRSSTANVALLDAGYAWAEAQPRLQVPHPGARASTEPQIVVNGNTALGARRARLGHGHLRDVPDHAGDLGVALPERRVREGRRHRAPGRGRDRRLRVRDRRLLRRQVRGDDHLRARLLAQAGGHRPRGDGARFRWSSSTCSAAARARASRPRSSRATCSTAIFGSHGDAPKVVMAPSTHRGLLLLDDHRAQDRRDVQHGRRACCPTRASRRRSSRSRGRSSARRGSRRRSTRAPVPDGRQAVRLGSGHRPRAPLRARASPAACTRSPASRTTARATSPTTRRSTRQGCARAASSSRRCRRRCKPPPVFGDRRGRPAGDRLGQHEGRDRGSRRARCAPRAAASRRCTCTFLQPMPPGISEIMQRLQAA